jgi:methionyl-tRNA formyltransferase
MRFALVGAVHASRVALERLARPGIEVLVCPLDVKRAGRHSDFCDLAPLAAARGLEVLPIVNVNDEAVLAALRTFAPDVIGVFGWSQIVGEAFRAIPRLGVLGWHPALLPKNRGRAVIPWTILQGATETGFTIFWIDAGVDSGDVAAQVRFAVASDETATTLYAKVEDAAGRSLDELLPRLLAGDAPRRPQDHAQATWCAKRGPEDGRIDWSRPMQEVWRLVRATTHPYPGAFCECADGRLVIWEARPSDDRRYWGLPGQVQAISADGALVQCGDGGNLLVTVVEREPGRPEPAAAVLKAHEHLARPAAKPPS